jgi:hypothetical protein
VNNTTEDNAMKRIFVGFWLVVGNTLSYLFPPLVGPRPYNETPPYFGPCPPL